jgi:hypothetical protein
MTKEGHQVQLHVYPKQYDIVSGCLAYFHIEAAFTPIGINKH